MLDKPVDEIVTDADGKFVGVRSGNETVKAKQVIGDPSYFGAGNTGDGGKVRVVEEGKVVRAICILKHPIPGTDDADSVQIIIPQNQVRRRNGMSIPCAKFAATNLFLVRHLHRHGLVNAQCMREGCLCGDCKHNCGNRQTRTRD